MSTADSHVVFCSVQHNMDFSSSAISGSWLTDRGLAIESSESGLE